MVPTACILIRHTNSFLKVGGKICYLQLKYKIIEKQNINLIKYKKIHDFCLSRRYHCHLKPSLTRAIRYELWHSLPHGITRGQTSLNLGRVVL